MALLRFWRKPELVAKRRHSELASVFLGEGRPFDASFAEGVPRAVNPTDAWNAAVRFTTSRRHCGCQNDRRDAARLAFCRSRQTSRRHQREQRMDWPRRADVSLATEAGRFPGAGAVVEFVSIHSQCSACVCSIFRREIRIALEEDAADTNLAPWVGWAGATKS